MKDIKFRAWSKAEEKMYLPEKSDMLSINFLGGVSYGGDTWADDMVLMQYTGLKDKNGREIYEGDILYRERPGLFNGDPDRKEQAIVVWNEEQCGFCGEGSTTSIRFYINNPIPYKVIGNIYENPDLIKEGIEI